MLVRKRGALFENSHWILGNRLVVFPEKGVVGLDPPAQANCINIMTLWVVGGTHRALSREYPSGITRTGCFSTCGISTAASVFGFPWHVNIQELWMLFSRRG